MAGCGAAAAGFGLVTVAVGVGFGVAGTGDTDGFCPPIELLFIFEEEEEVGTIEKGGGATGEAVEFMANEGTNVGALKLGWNDEANGFILGLNVTFSSTSPAKSSIIVCSSSSIVVVVVVVVKIEVEFFVIFFFAISSSVNGNA